tara:strand:+ start:39 stop:881 length:843 start_codon:yes stop_codon:yes gene_type:complete
MKTIILDHDLGTNPDDFFSLLMLLNSDMVDLRLVVSGNNFPIERAVMAQKIIQQNGKEGVAVYAGEQAGHIDFNAYHLIEGVNREIGTDYKTAIKNVLDESDAVVYLCIQGTANISAFLKAYPEYVDTFEIIHMGMKMPGNEFMSGGTNMEADPLGAKYLYEFGLKHFKVVGAHTTINDAIRVTPETDLYKKLSVSEDENHKMLLQHLHDYNVRRGIWPALHDPLTSTVALGHDFVAFEEVAVEFNDEGEYRMGGDTSMLLSKGEVQNPKLFMKLCTRLV